MLRWTLSPRALHLLAIASVVANIGIVVTGGAVRLTGSGLGCPTWPSCADGSLTPRPEASYHGIIENTNRQLTWILSVIAIATLVAAVRQRRERGLAAAAFAMIPVQAVVGGISVLTHLNPWVVGLHFLTSMVAIALTTVLWWRLRGGLRLASATPAAVLLARGVVAVTAAVLVVGTVVTGSGPHAGDAGAKNRIGLDPAAVSQLHADLVMALIGLSVGLAVLLRAVRAPGAARCAADLLLAVEAGQAVIGYVQYFTHVPAVLVGFHMLGACLTWFAALQALLAVQAPLQVLTDDVDDQADQRTYHRAVDPDELQVASDLQFEPTAGLLGVPPRHSA